MNYYGGNDYRDYLAHYGVLGMHWGIRRYQPYSYTGGRKSGEPGKEVGEAKKKSKSVDRGGSNTNEAKVMAVKILADIGLTVLNPLNAGRLVSDVDRLVKYTKSKKKVRDLNKEFETSSVEKKTGLRLKHREMSEKEDMARVNPGYHNFDANTKSNCMLCTTAYDLRRRGYNVTAKTALFGYKADDVKTWYPKAKVESPVPFPKTGKEVMKLRRRAMTLSGNKEVADKTIAALKKDGNGARGNLMIQWGSGGGHSVVYEVKNDKVILRDCQSNKTYENPEKILKKCISSQYVRLDNIDFDPKKIKEAVR